MHICSETIQWAPLAFIAKTYSSETEREKTGKIFYASLNSFFNAFISVPSDKIFYFDKQWF